MPDVRLKFNGEEIEPKTGVTTLGRTTDNDVSFPNDSNVSRYHAEIESRGEEFCLIDLGSSNGTTVNDTKVSGEVYLKPGDRILLGGSSELTFDIPEKEDEPETEDSSSPVNLPPVGDAIRQAPSLVAAAPNPAAGSRTMLMVAGGAVLIAVIVVGAAGAIYYRSVTSVCDAKAVIVKPETGETILTPTEIEIETENSECVAKAVYTLDGAEIASVEDFPYTATLDPKEYPDMADGLDHILGVVLVDEDGNRVPQAGDVLLVLETRTVEKPEEKPTGPDNVPQTPPIGPKAKEISLIDMQEMTAKLVRQFSGNRGYNVSNKQFLQEVQKKTAEYAQEGYYDAAAKYRDSIRVAFIKDQFLDAPVGFILAMSRTRFDPKRQGTEEGLWRMSPEFVKANGYDGTCAGQAISEPSQQCAARAAAVYMKALIAATGDDPIYAAAAFGKSPADAAIWNATMPAKREDVWNTIKTPAEREQLLRFFAAGIVAENPQKFGLKRDKAISGLYP